MNYLKKYNIKEEEIEELKDIYNEHIIRFLKENQIFVEEKLEYLKEENYIIYPIIKNNIRIFLEIISELKRKIRNIENKKFTRKHIQMILMDENLYRKY